MTVSKQKLKVNYVDLANQVMRHLEVEPTITDLSKLLWFGYGGAD